MALLLVLLTLLPGALLCLGLSQAFGESQIARDLNRSGSLRSRGLYLYSVTRLPSDQRRGSRTAADLFAEMVRIRRELSQRYPKQVAGFDPEWNRFRAQYQSSGEVDWPTTLRMLDAADHLTNAIDAAVQVRTARDKRWFAVGILGLGLTLPCACLLLHQLRIAQAQVSSQNAQLVAAAERFRSLFDGLPVSCFGYDRDGSVTAWNDTSRLVFDRTYDEVSGRPFWELLSYPHRWDGAKAMVAQVIGGDALREIEWTHPHRDGSVRHFLSSVFPLRDASGAIVGGLAANVDITSRVEASARLEAASEELRRSNAALQDFAYVASHDLKEPLRKIQTFGGMLRRRLPDANQEQSEHLERMMSAAARMQSLIDGLMEYSRVTTRGREPVSVPLDKILAEVLLDLEARIADTGGTVHVEPLPCVCADPVQMRQLFQNLIGNALKFHAPGRPAIVQVALLNNPSPGWATLTVADNGIGFDPRFAERIFEVFERLEGQHRFEGTGIGLAICRKIVERHGGTITACGTSDEGAVFTLTLPLA